ncbi:hypothetical protein HQ576_14220 [bacterium]|nr:hypothetical protein [bacterium]
MSEPLNIILLMADQWRWDTVFVPGHACQTPQLDRFAGRAQPFTRTYLERLRDDAGYEVSYLDGRGIDEQHDHGTRPPQRGHGAG